MLEKKHDPFISLKRTRDKTAGIESAPDDSPRGLNLYISDIDLPIDEKDLNNSLTAEVKVTPRRISKTETNGKKSSSFDLEITGIRFKS